MGKLERALERRLELVEASGRKEAARDLSRVLASIPDRRLVELLCPGRGIRLGDAANAEEWAAVGFTAAVVERAIGYTPGAPLDPPEMRRRLDVLLSPLDARLRRCGETYPDRLERT